MFILFKKFIDQSHDALSCMIHKQQRAFASLYSNITVGDKSLRAVSLRKRFPLVSHPF